MKKLKGIKLTEEELETLKKMTSAKGELLEKYIKQEEIEKEKKEILKKKLANKGYDRKIYYLWNDTKEKYEEYEKGVNIFSKSEICQKLGIKRNYTNKVLELLKIQYFDGETGQNKLTEKGKKYAIEVPYRFGIFNIYLLKNTEEYIKRNLKKIPKEWIKKK